MPQGPSPLPTPHRPRVLLIEPDPMARAQMAELLEREGYDVTTVPTVEAAVTDAFWSGRSRLQNLLVHGRSRPRQTKESRSPTPGRPYDC